MQKLINRQCSKRAGEHNFLCSKRFTCMSYEKCVEKFLSMLESFQQGKEDDTILRRLFAICCVSSTYILIILAVLRSSEHRGAY